MGRKGILMLGAAILVTGALSPMAWAGGRTIKLTAILQSANVNAGVNSQAKLRLRTSSARPAGSATWNCAFTTPGGGNGTDVCTDTYKLRTGQIVVHYSFNVNRGNGIGRHAITSGTGAFKHARGSVTTKIIAQDTYSVTIRL